MAKPKILTINEREFITSPRKRNSYKKEIQRQYDQRIRDKAKQMIKELKFLAEELPENQQKQIFTKDLFLPMVRSVINPNREGIVPDLNQFKRRMRTEKIIVKNKRVLVLCSELIEMGKECGFKLVPSKLASLLAASIRGESEIKIVQNIGHFLKKDIVTNQPR